MSVRVGISIDKEDHRDWQALERLAGVPEGTSDETRRLDTRVDELRRQGDHDTANVLTCEHYRSPVGELYRFTFMGFGRISDEARACIQAFGLRAGEGRTGHPGQVQAILKLQGVPEERRKALLDHPMILTWG